MSSRIHVVVLDFIQGILLYVPMFSELSLLTSMGQPLKHKKSVFFPRFPVSIVSSQFVILYFSIQLSSLFTGTLLWPVYSCYREPGPILVNSLLLEEASKFNCFSQIINSPNLNRYQFISLFQNSKEIGHTFLNSCHSYTHLMASNGTHLMGTAVAKVLRLCRDRVCDIPLFFYPELAFLSNHMSRIGAVFPCVCVSVRVGV